jgi:hypothetical protein
MSRSKIKQCLRYKTILEDYDILRARTVKFHYQEFHSIYVDYKINIFIQNQISSLLSQHFNFFFRQLGKNVFVKYTVYRIELFQLGGKHFKLSNAPLCDVYVACMLLHFVATSFGFMVPELRCTSISYTY